MQWRRWRNTTARLSYGKARRCHPIFPINVNQSCRNGAVPGQPDHNRNKAVVTVKPRDMTLAVWRVSQTVQQHHRADGSALGFQHERTIEILNKVPWIDRAAFEIAIHRYALVRIKFFRHLSLNVVKNLCFLG